MILRYATNEKTCFSGGEATSDPGSPCKVNELAPPARQQGAADTYIKAQVVTCVQSEDSTSEKKEISATNWSFTNQGLDMGPTTMGMSPKKNSAFFQ